MTTSRETSTDASKFDFSAYPEDTLFYDRRSTRCAASARRDDLGGPAATSQPERPVRKERRRRVDPTTFEKQYTVEELEFMNAMHRFKVQSGKTFPTHGEVLKVARSLGYRKLAEPDGPDPERSEHA